MFEARPAPEPVTTQVACNTRSESEEMHAVTKTAVLLMTVLGLTLGPALAGPIIFADHTPVDLPGDNTPVDLPPPDHTPVDLPPGPIWNDDLSDALIGENGDDTANLAKMVLSCRIEGGDLILTNVGDLIPSGARVKWNVGTKSGSVLLPNGLRPGQKAKVEQVTSLSHGTCIAEVQL